MYYEASRGARAQPCDSNCNRSPLDEIKYIIFLFLRSPKRHQSMQNVSLSSATQHTMPPEFGGNGERSVLVLGSFCLPCYMILYIYTA